MSAAQPAVEARGRYDRELARLRDEGYALLPDALDVALDIEPLVEECCQVLDDLIHALVESGELADDYSRLSGLERLCAFIADTGKSHFDHFSIFLPFARTLPDRPMYLHPAMFSLLRSPRLLDAIEPVIGPEIAVSPFHIMRIKPPEHKLPLDVRNSPNGSISQTVWHQDAWGIEESASETRFITVWIPIVPSDEENGCLVVAPGSHRSQTLEVHCNSSPSRPHSKGIPDERVAGERVPVPARPGDIILLDKYVQHSSLVNRSDRLRWSCDLRYQEADRPAGQCGRPAWVARSRSDPGREATDFEAWRRMWRRINEEQGENPPADPTRFSTGHPLCA